MPADAAASPRAKTAETAHSEDTGGWFPARLVASRERITLVLVTGGFIAIFAVFAAFQSVVVHRMGLADDVHPNPAGSLLPRLLVNFTCVAMVVLFALFVRVERRRRVSLVALVVVFSLAVGAARLALQLALHIYSAAQPGTLVVDFAAAFVVTVASFAIGVGVVALQRRVHEQERAHAEQRLRASAALAALQAEELRVRREVSEGLHGTVQQRLVLIETRLAGLARELEDAPDVHSAKLVVDGIHELRLEVDTLREVDVREVSQLLYPSGVELGLAQAVRMMIRRVPATIATSVIVDESALAADDPEGSRLTAAQRLLLVRVLEEAVSNALRHGHASSLRLELCAEAGLMRLVFDDDGVGLPEQGATLRGLALLRDRLHDQHGELRLDASPLGGARLVATLPV